MIVNTVQGDLIKLFEDGEFDLIAHGCNCYHTMGSGVAGQLVKKYPNVLTIDRIRTAYGDPMKLGNFTMFKPEKDANRYIFNLYTQFDYGTDSRKVEYAAVRDCFIKLDRSYSFMRKPLAIPMIGAGLAGGDWNLISTIINKSTPNLDVVVVEFSK